MALENVRKRLYALAVCTVQNDVDDGYLGSSQWILSFVTDVISAALILQQLPFLSECQETTKNAPKNANVEEKDALAVDDDELDGDSDDGDEKEWDETGGLCEKQRTTLE